MTTEVPFVAAHRSRLRPRAGSAWLAGALVIAAAVAAPLAVLVAAAFGADLAHWRHLAEFVLPQALANTLLLLAGVGAIVSVVGTGCAWLVTAYDFPGRRMLSWALLLPLAVPTYIVAFAYLDLLHPIGPVQGAIRWLLGFDSPRQFRLPDLRSLPGAVFVLGFVLYPYVYLSTRAMFVTQSASLLEAARTLGAGRIATFWRVVVPLARPAIAVGVSLALLETLNDIGASEFLGVQTLTVSVYTTWITRSDLAGAAQIALAMLAIVVGMIALERYGRRRQRYAHGRRMRPIAPRRLTGAAAWSAAVLGWLPVLLGFGAPAAYLAVETGKRLHLVGGVSAQLLTGLANTLTIATAATVATLACGLVVAWAARAQRDSARAGPARVAARVASLGYAVPGTVLAIGLLIPLAAIDRLLGAALGRDGLLLMGSAAALVIAYTVRFLAISAGSIEAGLARIPPSLEQAARSLGETAGGTLRRVHLPLLRPALTTSALLVFVDAMKELPATLLLRPLNFDTLATWLYAEAARGTYEEGAVAAFAIVLAGLAPVILLARTRHKTGA
ncbi:ABC transporter permease [Burkholderia pseudomultivorans]|uniref:2-aminoethylphosphonate transport system permease protein PhnU n=1 Tax=Burkholderia pseudomultivorans TaxID=1207504 RepID=A0ABU2DW03_9BURK|nr:putative 2-aminoethylphosphonate transport system permease protein PhnU [Burkholderia pseudomultivorans]MDR8734741.1 putative 2-aminoethylphosphonate transport system permease protein PhnU [Burkholderia pseudomultivorans]MDR8740707.1 putative 2-aminoethylphosphonate transport system permease protein PhnU [Burkholderia pseudomultivorans]MDR8751628.1 putative 2-aminoethylphosphonate transport system permease protein PhnU [Burkholderia pseudomultivorans]MDR8777121.1 putative 2-aminoethylphospho